MAIRPVRILILRTAVYFVPVLVAWLLRIRFIHISTPDRIGHYSYGTGSRIGRDHLRSLQEPDFAATVSTDAPTHARADPAVAS